MSMQDSGKNNGVILPTYLCEEIFGFLTLKDLWIAKQVCHYWRDCMRQEVIWRQALRNSGIWVYNECYHTLRKIRVTYLHNCYKSYVNFATFEYTEYDYAGK